MSYQITRQEINILLGGDFVAVDKKGKQLPPGIRQRANGRYEGRVKVEYRSYSVYADTITETKKKMRELKYKLDHGLFVEKEKITLDEWNKTWMVQYKKNRVKNSTYNSYQKYYNMFEEISKCGKLLNKYGGHPMAAGISLDIDKIDEFRKALNENQTMTENVLTPTVWIDVPMPVDYVDIKLIKQFEKLQPFGKGNEKPVFADRNLTVRQSAVIGKNKNVLRCQLESEHGKLVTAIRFKLDGQEIPEVGRKISMVYYPDINEYNGIVSIQFRIEDWRYV